jgi:hypothetical protein
MRLFPPSGPCPFHSTPTTSQRRIARASHTRPFTETVELWQTLQFSVPVASKRPLAWALFELAKYRHKDADKQKLPQRTADAESAVSTFREVSPLWIMLVLPMRYITYADRMLELDNNQEAATYAEESVHVLPRSEGTNLHRWHRSMLSTSSFHSRLRRPALPAPTRPEDALNMRRKRLKCNTSETTMGIHSTTIICASPADGRHSPRSLRWAGSRTSFRGCNSCNSSVQPEGGKCPVWMAGGRRLNSSQHHWRVEVASPSPKTTRNSESRRAIGWTRAILHPS